MTHDPYPAYAWPGGYPVAYVATDDVLCSGCARAAGHGSPFIHWEGPAVECAECGRLIESAYGDPDEDAQALQEGYAP